ncbi:MAG: NACHT domain-containing protein [Oscillochloris sp.]|nr:NACHT domain-containing protein [Oscillochloris sp.]
MSNGSSESRPSVEALTAMLAGALPAELSAAAPTLAGLLAGMQSGDGTTLHRAITIDPGLKPALRALAGRAISSERALIAFGSGNQFGDITIGDVVGGDKITVTLNLPVTRLNPREQRNRRAMLHKLRAIWVDGLLAGTFTRIGRVNLRLVSRPELVSRPLARQVQQLDDAANRPGPDLTLPAAFQASGGALLILGDPGAGKTTLLLELLRDLLDVAEAEESRPIPVILPLTSWVNQRRSLAEWIVDELGAQYDVPHDVARNWLESDALLPLLDGLDEVDDEHRPACVAAINRFRSRHFMPMVVCVRSDAYRALPELLRLELAIEVQPLAPEEITQALAPLGAALQRVRALLNADPDLDELVRSPLLLAVLAQVADNVAIASPPVPSECNQCGNQLRPGARFCPVCGVPATREPTMLRHALVAAYVERVFARGDTSLRMPQARIEAGLSFLSRQMHAQHLSNFHLEDLQPGWLPSRATRRAYTILDRAGGAVLATLLCLIPIGMISLALGVALAPTDLWLLYPLSGALFGGFSVTRQRSAGRIVRDTLVGAAAGLPLGALFGIVGYLVDASRRDLIDVIGLDLPRALIAAAAVAGLSAALAGGLYAMLTGGPGFGPRRIAVIERVRWSWRRGIRTVPIGIGIGAAVGAAIGALVFGPIMLLSLAAAGLPAEILASVPGMSVLGIVLLFIIVLTFSLSFLGAAFGLIGGLTGGLRAGVVTPLATVGEGLRRSARSALIGGACFGLAAALVPVGLIGLANAIFSTVENSSVIAPDAQLYAIVIFATQIAIVGAFSFGGFVIISHWILRLMLAWSGHLPWNVVGLLEEATERGLLRRVGGGYIFLHRVLLDHYKSRDAVV